MTRQRNEKSELISVSRILFCGAQCHQNPRTSGKKSFYQREMTSSGTRLRFTVIAVNMETEGQVSWRVFINWDGVISVPAVAWPLFPAGLLGFASDYGLQGNHFPFLPLCLCCAAAQVYSVRSKPSPLIKPPVRVLSLIWLHHDRQQSCPTEYWMRFFHPQL